MISLFSPRHTSQSIEMSSSCFSPIISRYRFRMSCLLPVIRHLTRLLVSLPLRASSCAAVNTVGLQPVFAVAPGVGDGQSVVRLQLAPHHLELRVDQAVAALPIAPYQLAQGFRGARPTSQQIVDALADRTVQLDGRR